MACFHTLKEVLNEANTDPDIIGLFLGGSWGKGLATRHSDYDIAIVVKDSKLASYKKRHKCDEQTDIDLTIYSLSQFKKHAAWGGPEEWDRYNFVHLKAKIDKTGEIQKLINEKSTIPKSKVKGYISGTTDGYINQVYRSIKCARDGKGMGARLEALKEIPLFINLLFALEGRISPYYKYLDWELKNHPIKQFPMGSKEILDNLLKIADTGDIKTQQRLLSTMEKVLRKKGFNKVFDSWGTNLSYMKNFKMTG